MTQLATSPSATENRAWLRDKVARRGWTDELEAMGGQIMSEALRRHAAWTELYWSAYQDGVNLHHLTGHRLSDYAHAYADTNEDQDTPEPLDTFWLEWTTGEVEAPAPDGRFHHTGHPELPAA